MLERLICAGLIMAVGAAAWLLYNHLALRKAARHARRDPLLATVPSGVPTVVYFTAPFCAPCRNQQLPALHQLQHELGAKVQVVQVDATEQPEVADRWGVFSAPTTFVLDKTLALRYVNRGVASLEVLKQQLNTA